MRCPDCGLPFPPFQGPVMPTVPHWIICAGCTAVCALVGFGAGLDVRLTTDEEFEQFIAVHGFRQMYFVACLTADAMEESCPRTI